MAENMAFVSWWEEPPTHIAKHTQFSRHWQQLKVWHMSGRQAPAIMSKWYTMVSNMDCYKHTLKGFSSLKKVPTKINHLILLQLQSSGIMAPLFAHLFYSLRMGF